MEKGGGKGSWSAWKASEMAKVYEKKGGGYEGMNRCIKAPPVDTDTDKHLLLSL